MTARTASRPSPLAHLARPGTALAAVLTVAALTSCSGGSDMSSDTAATAATTGAGEAPSSASGGSSAPGNVQTSSSTLQATEVDFAIELSDRELEAGTYTVEVTNEGGATHDLVVEDSEGIDVAATAVIPPGGSDTVEVTLEPGEYSFYCSVGNHRGMGMELIVTVV